MSNVKLYRVTIECDVWVLAASRAEAEEIMSHEPDVLDDVRMNGNASAHLTTETDDDSLPWRARSARGAPEQTAAEWAQHTATVGAFAKHEAEMAAAQVALPGVTL